jgi:Ca2+-binding EF-hand superfamily protein
LFSALDSDGDGFITRDELKNFIQETEKLNEIMEILDTKKNGQIEFESFIKR